MNALTLFDLGDRDKPNDAAAAAVSANDWGGVRE